MNSLKYFLYFTATSLLAFSAQAGQKPVVDYFVGSDTVAINPMHQLYAAERRPSFGPNYKIDLGSLKNGGIIKQFDLGTTGVGALAFSQDGKKLAVGSDPNYEGIVGSIWDVDSDTMTQEFNITLPMGKISNFVYAIAINQAGDRVVTGSADKTARLWDVDSGKEINTLTGHSADIWAVAFSPDGDTVATGSRDETIKLWDANTGEEIRTLKGHTGVVDALTFSNDGTTLISGSGDGSVKLWNVDNGTVVKTFQGDRTVRSVAASPSMNIIVAGFVNGTVTVWNKKGEEMVTFSASNDSIRNVVFKGLDQFYTVAEKTIKLWDLSKLG